MESTFRPIRPEERAVLDRRARPAALDTRGAILPTLMTGLPIWFALLCVDAFLLPRVAVIEAAYIFGTLIATMALTFRFYRNRASRNIHARNVGAATLLTEFRAIEQVEDWRVRIVDAIEIWIDEDVGSQYYLQLEDGRVLVLHADWFERDDKEEPCAPNRELIVTRLPQPRQGIIIDVQRVGESFAPFDTRETSTDEWESHAIQNDGDILPGPLSRYTKPVSPSLEVVETTSPRQ
jgi:hypothetical protein